MSTEITPETLHAYASECKIQCDDGRIFYFPWDDYPVIVCVTCGGAGNFDSCFDCGNRGYFIVEDTP